ncbi:DUF3800 domain-containing protein [Phragmitibacter flavus]|uniref:DUF3800 domain-containing protein n=1 Tax=Phragmitibacter flavus TaxID=2576071 RepID=A0A5R8KA45_9BACT|nr:DUF3800 domain-containing protein [Phragmitibacter flavus]TLD69193.1 DUF3800 domain-containing protein [Phragmitibacter flavus]
MQSTENSHLIGSDQKPPDGWIGVEKEYWIFADESVQDGSYFSNFFGGCIIAARQHAEVENRLRIRKAEIGFLKELKWQRVSEPWLNGYQQMISSFFDELRGGGVRMRLMFRDNRDSELQLSRKQRDESYFKLYYQFAKHAFGLAHIPTQQDGPRLRLFFDQFPHTHERVAQFKAYIAALPLNKDLREKNLKIDLSHVTEVDSKEHVLMQCVDIVLGAMAFRLNNLHLEKPKGQKQRGKRTLAKDKLYRHILTEIRTLKPHFNPKISTACEPFPEGNWSMSYRHWLFKPKSSLK